MLLIFPPVAKACEPPAGIAKLAGALSAHGLPCTVLDANLEGLLSLAQQPQPPSDTWTRRAVKNLPANIAALRAPQTYRSFDRYSRAVRDVNRVLAASARASGATLSLADYHHAQLSPVRSADLIASAEHPERNPFYGYFSKRLREILDDPLVGFSLNYLSQALCTFAMIGCVRKELPGAKIVLGGSLVTSWTKRPRWKNTFAGLVDHLIAGPGEGALLDLLGVKDLKPNRHTPDYASLPLQQYLAPGVILPYSGSSGCFWHNCSFCPEGTEDNPYVPVPPAQAMADMNALISKTKPALVHLLDNAISPALMRALLEKPLGVPWYGFARIGRELADLDYCIALKHSGCVMLKLGLESGDQAVLDRLRKGIDLATASQALENLRKAGIATYVYLLFGTPPETAQTAQKTLEFVVRHRDAISFLNLAVFNMPVCGDEAGEYETEQFYAGDLSLYTGFRHPHGWDRNLVRRFLDKEFKRHPAVAAIVKNDPPVFTSNHAAFFAPLVK
ncbi:MAG: radical SAM protein [Deltaproteobacteria bacterium]|nr:radical SAM protein [Deltaproteobacteria bacterium]